MQDCLYEIRKGIAYERQRLRKSLDTIIKHTKNEGFTPDDLSVTIRNVEWYSCCWSTA